MKRPWSWVVVAGCTTLACPFWLTAACGQGQGGSLVDALERRCSYNDCGHWPIILGATLLGVGGVSLGIGIPLLVHGGSASKSVALSAVQIGPGTASLSWTF